MLFYFLSVLTGALIAAMVAVNGVMTAVHGIYSATVIIHVVGLFLIGMVCVIRRDSPFRYARQPLWLYLGGVIGVGTTVFNNVAFGKISMSAIVALGLLGQAVTSLVIDQFGLLGMQRRPMRAVKLFGLACMLLGTTYMLWGTALVPLPIIVSLLAGTSVVLSRTVNARLAAVTSDQISTLYNYIVGLLVAGIVLLMAGRGETRPIFMLDSRIWIYCGGMLGVLVVLLSNLTVSRISAFYMTLLLFVGQVFTGIAIDMIMTRSISHTNLVGGILVAVGMIINLWLDLRWDRTHRTG